MAAFLTFTLDISHVALWGESSGVPLFTFCVPLVESIKISNMAEEKDLFRAGLRDLQQKHLFCDVTLIAAMDNTK